MRYGMKNLTSQITHHTSLKPYRVLDIIGCEIRDRGDRGDVNYFMEMINHEEDRDYPIAFYAR